MFACVCLLLSALVVSGTELTFQYQPTVSYRRSNEPCKICYGGDCLQMEQARCEYYIEADSILREAEQVGEDNPVIRAEVDRMLHKYMEDASATRTECVPLVSQYTNCTKENICTGCQTCNCDANGSWNCIRMAKCRANVQTDVDHRMLMIVMDNLIRGGKGKRNKRQIQQNPVKQNSKDNKICYEEIARWMYGDEAFNNTKEPNLNKQNYTDDDNRATATYIAETTTPDAFSNPEPDTQADYLAFDEVLNNIAVESKNYTRRKPLKIIHNDSSTFDYMIFDEDVTENVTDKAGTEIIDNIDNKYVLSNTGIGETDVVIDLLESAKRNQGETFTANWTDYTELSSKINIYPALDYIDNFILGSKNIMKRDTQARKAQRENANTTNNLRELRNNVLLPLSNIINDKQKELEELLRVSENLINIMRSYQNQSFEANIKENENEQTTDSSISIYNFEITPELENEFRRSNKNLLDKHLKKLKRDIYEVIRDIAAIHKIQGTTNIPQDLKILIRAMKHYVRNQAKLESKINISVAKGTKNRRKIDETNQLKKDPWIDGLVDIIKVIDRNMPDNNALGPLSPTSKKIIDRIIKNNYIDEFSVVGLRVFDPQYNLTNDLKNIGTEWSRMTNNVAQSTIYDRVHAMKLLHLILSIDIVKMNDAMSLLDFAYNRRMILVEGSMGGEVIDKINKGLRAINEKIKVIIQLHNKNRQLSKENIKVTKKFQKDSFMRKLKNILKTSKSDIVNLLKRKVSKKDIVKELAKKKIDELSMRRFMEFEETMKKWQKNLNLAPRDKRFAGDVNYKNRMKNIIPRYLRGKLNPAIDASKSKKTNRKHGKQKLQSKSSMPLMKSNLTTTKSKLNGL